MAAAKGILINSNRLAKSTVPRLRAIRLSGSPASKERTELVKDKQLMSVALSVSHNLLTAVDNFCG
jgi:hypothetical protein